MALGEHDRDVGDLGEQVEVGRQARHGAIEEDHVLDVEHQLFGHSCPIPQQRLDDALHLFDQLFAGERGRVDGGLIES